MTTNHTKVHVKEDKIQEALELLNTVAKEKKEALQEMITEQYSHVRDVLHDKVDKGIHTANRMGKEFSRTLRARKVDLKKSVHEIDKRVRKNPWIYIGGAALTTLVIGKFLRRK